MHNVDEKYLDRLSKNKEAEECKKNIGYGKTRKKSSLEKKRVQ